jgi:hypothetical protein
MSMRTIARRWQVAGLLLGLGTASLVVAGCDRRTTSPAVDAAVSPPDAPSSIDAPFPDAARVDAGPLDAEVSDTGAGTDARSLDARVDTGPRMDTGPGAPTDAGPRPRPDATSDSPDAVGCGFVLTTACSSGSLPSVYDGPCGGRAELHIVGQYQPDADGSVEVTVSRSGIPVILSLTSYEPTVWNVVAAPDTVIERVILDGYNAQSVVGLPPGTPVLDRSGPGRGVACAYEWPRDRGGCDTERLVESLRRETGLEPSSFAGCYEGSRYTIRE